MLENFLIKTVGLHNHEQDPDYAQAEVVKFALKKKAVQSNDVAAQIITDVVPDNRNLQLKLPSKAQLTRFIRFARDKHAKYPKIGRYIKMCVHRVHGNEGMPAHCCVCLLT